MSYPLFITFEGPEGSGKTTQMKLLEQRLYGLGYSVISTREPGGTPQGEQIRDLLLDPASRFSPMTEAFLFNAARVELMLRVIKPALAAGQVVLCDRHADSTLAYQGYGHGEPVGVLNSLNDIAVANTYPDLTLYLDIDPVESLARKLGQEVNKFEMLHADFHRKVRAGYQRLELVYPWRFRRIDARQRIEVVAEDIWQELQRVRTERQRLDRLRVAEPA